MEVGLGRGRGWVVGNGSGGGDENWGWGRGFVGESWGVLECGEVRGVSKKWY